MPFRQQLKPFVRKMELCMYSKDGVERDLEVEELPESWVLSPTPAAPSHRGWDLQGCGCMGASASPKIPLGACPLLPAAGRDLEDTTVPEQTLGARLL